MKGGTADGPSREVVVAGVVRVFFSEGLALEAVSRHALRSLHARPY